MDHKLQYQRKLKIFSFLGVVCLLVPLSIFILWIFISDIGTTHAERVDIFNSYFPSFLTKRWDTTLLSILFCFLALILSVKSLQLKYKFWSVLNYIVLILSSILLFLNLFSMM